MTHRQAVDGAARERLVRRFRPGAQHWCDGRSSAGARDRARQAGAGARAAAPAAAARERGRPRAVRGTRYISVATATVAELRGRTGSPTNRGRPARRTRSRRRPWRICPGDRDRWPGCGSGGTAAPAGTPTRSCSSPRTASAGQRASAGSRPPWLSARGVRSGPSAGRTRWRCPSPTASGAGLSETARDAILGRPAGRPDRARTAMTSAAYAVRDQRCAPAWSHALWLAAAQRAIEQATLRIDAESALWWALVYLLG